MSKKHRMKRQKMRYYPGKRKWTPEELREKEDLRICLKKLADAGFDSVMFASSRRASVVRFRRQRR